MQTKTVEWQGVTITAHTSTGMDELNRDVVLFKLAGGADVAERHRDNTFARLMTQTDSIEGVIDFRLPHVTDTPESLQAARDAFLKLPGKLVRVWIRAVDEVDQPPSTDPDLQPLEKATTDPN